MAVTEKSLESVVPPPTGSARIDAGRLAALSTRATTTGDRRPLEIEKPFTGELLGTVPHGTADDVAAAIERGRAAQAGWERTPFAQRRRILMRLHDLVLDRQEEILDLIQLESGKARRHAFEEILDVAIVARYYANTAEEYPKTRRKRGAFPLLTQTWEHPHPGRLVGMISPRNCPFTLSMRDAIAAPA